MAQDSGDLAKRMKPLTIEDNGAQPIDQAPPPRGREVSSAARTLPPGLDNQARMFYWKIEDARLDYCAATSDSFASCKDKCLDLLVHAFLPKYARIKTLHLLSGVVTIAEGDRYLNEALAICDEIEEGRGEKDETARLLRDKTKLLMQQDQKEQEAGLDHAPELAEEEDTDEDIEEDLEESIVEDSEEKDIGTAGEDTTMHGGDPEPTQRQRVEGGGEEMDVDVDESMIYHDAPQNTEEAQKIVESGGFISAAKLTGVKIPPMTGKPYYESEAEMQEYQAQQTEEEREAMELAMKEGMQGLEEQWRGGDDLETAAAHGPPSPAESEENEQQKTEESTEANGKKGRVKELLARFEQGK